MLKGFESITPYGNMSEEKIRLVEEILQSRTKDNTILSKALEARSQLSGPQIRHIIHTLRTELKPVCANSKGYLYCTADEVADTIYSIEQRIRSLSEVASSMRKTLSNMRKESEGEQIEFI